MNRHWQINISKNAHLYQIIMVKLSFTYSLIQSIKVAYLFKYLLSTNTLLNVVLMPRDSTVSKGNIPPDSISFSEVFTPVGRTDINQRITKMNVQFNYVW